MSSLTFKFNAIPNEFFTDEFLEDPIMMKFIRWIYKNISSVSRIGRMNGRNIPLEPFEFIFGRETSAEKAGISPMNARTRANQLKSMGYIEKVTSKSTSTFTVYRLMTESFEQNGNQHSNQVTNQHSNQHSNHNIEPRTKNLKRNKEINKENFPSSSNESNPSSETNDAGYSSMEGESSIPAESTSHETSDNARYALSVNDLQKNIINNSSKKVKRRHNVETTNEEHEDLIKFVEEKKSYTEKGKGLEFIELCYDELSEWKERPARTKVQLKQCAAKCIKKWVASAVKKSILEDEEIKAREKRLKLYSPNASGVSSQNKIEDNIVEIIESRKAFANKFRIENWDKFRIEMRPETKPEFLLVGNDKLYYKDKQWDQLFPHLMKKAIA